MTRRATYIRTFFVILLILPCIAIANTLSVSIKALTQHIEQLIKTKKIPGCAVAIIDHDQIVYMNAFGVRKMSKGKKGYPIDLDTVFQLGSISKPITATLVAILQRNGRLNLDQAVQYHLPWIQSDTTVRHLLSHTSGYARTGWNNKIEANTARITLINDLSSHTQNTPGETFDYHNLAFSLLEDIIKHTNQAPFENLLQHYLFNPAGMTRASCGYIPFESCANKAWPHQITKKGSLAPSSSLSQFYHAHVPSAGGINASIRDMANFLFLHINGQENLISTHDLSPFHTPVAPTKDALGWFKEEAVGADLNAWYGLGWRILDIDHQRIIYHGGWLKGFKNFLAFSPDRKVGIVILHNSESSFSKKAAIRFLRQIL
ncbi:MAG: serine hydrolase domain-containing protein [Pseudomonadota bacterium]